MDLKKPSTKKTMGLKKETEKRQINVPKEFITKIENLGMNVEDAEILFKSKIDWCAVYSENKVYCVEPGCNYFTTIDNVKFKSPARPGDVMYLDVKISGNRGPLYKFVGTATINDKVTAVAQFSAMIVEPGR